MIQYITMLILCESNQILFHAMPCHNGSHYEKMSHITIFNANPKMNPKSKCDSHETS